MPDPTYLDGNAAAGALADLVAGDATVVIRSCAHCPSVAPLAELDLYPDAPGLVLRCRACGEVAARIVRRPDRLVVDLTGTRLLEVSI